MDILIRNKRTDELISVEVKTGEATRPAMQVAKDTELSAGKGTEFTGKRANQAGFGTGEPTGPIRGVEARPRVERPDAP